MFLDWELDAFDAPVGRRVAAGAATPPARGAAMTGTYCQLRPLTGADAAQLWPELGADEATWRYLPAGPWDSYAQFDSWIAAMAASGDPLFYAIIDHGGAVGLVAYLRMQVPARSIEVGWVTYSPRMRRSRVATETMYLMMRQAFELGFRRYEWKCNALNAPSIAAAHRLGFSFEGVFRDALVVKGRNRDTAWFSVRAEDWPALRPAFQAWLDPGNFDSDGRQRRRLSELTAPVVGDRWPNLTVRL
jgi:RimJ/RimL family protein N-acetyltransferase